MEITQDHTEKMENVIAAMRTGSVKCSKDYQCYTSSLENLCKIKGVVGSFDIIECHSEDARHCGFSVAADRSFYCNCPLRRYIATNFQV